MKHFKSSQEVYDAGYAIPQYDISRVNRTWRYNGKTFTTPKNVEVEKVQLTNFVIEVMPCEALDKTI
jgi:hypothetical protein